MRAKSCRYLSCVLLQVILQFQEAFWDTSVEYFGAALPPGDATSRGLCFMFWNLLPLTGQPILTALVSGQVQCPWSVLLSPGMPVNTCLGPGLLELEPAASLKAAELSAQGRCSISHNKGLSTCHAHHQLNLHI